MNIINHSIYFNLIVLDDEELDEEDLELLEENTGLKLGRSSGVSDNSNNNGFE